MEHPGYHISDGLGWSGFRVTRTSGPTLGQAGTAMGASGGRQTISRNTETRCPSQSCLHCGHWCFEQGSGFCRVTSCPGLPVTRMGDFHR